jgi:hypothetical protein
MKPDDIDSSYRPKPRPEITATELDGVIVLYDERYGTCHELNASASAIWARIDGTMTVAQLVDELAARYALDHATIERDAIRLLRHLGELRVLDGITTRSEEQFPDGTPDP